jgi:hypothetical protein
MDGGLLERKQLSVTNINYAEENDKIEIALSLNFILQVHITSKINWPDFRGIEE